MNKKPIYYLSILLLFFVTVTACSDDDDTTTSGDSSLVGSWKYDETTDTGAIISTSTLTFRSDGTMTVTTFSEFGNVSAEAKYEAKDGKITVTFEGGSEIWDYEVNGNELTVTDEKGTTVYTKK